MIRKSLTFAFGALTFGLVALVACSSDEGERYPDTSSFCEAKAQEECNGVAAVCGATVEACKAKRLSPCNEAAVAATAQGRKYKASLAESCLSKTRELYNARIVAPEKEAEQIDTCARVYEGTVLKNAACKDSYECQGALVCDKGVCSDKTERKQGDPCNNPGEVCAKGSYCGSQGQLKFCLPKKVKGDLCNADVPCAEDFRCIGTCTEKKQAGGDCATNDDCASAAPSCEAARCIAKSFAAGTPACKAFGGV